MTSWREDFKRAFHAVYKVYPTDREAFGKEGYKLVLAADEDEDVINGRLLEKNRASVLNSIEVRKDNVSLIEEDLETYIDLYSYDIPNLEPDSSKMRLTLHEHLKCAACQTNERSLGRRYCEGCGKELND